MPNKKNSFLKNVTESEDDGFFKKLSSPEAASAAWALPAEGELAVDVYETKKDIIVRAPIAGIKSEDLTLSLEGDVLTIRGARHDADKTERKYLCRECYWGAFSRSVILPSSVKNDKVKAHLERGILTVMLPKTKGTNISIADLGEA